MEFIINYWYIIVAIIAALVVVGVAIYRYFGLPSDAQRAVTEAEKELGGGTGKLKLRQVYDLFVTRFPWLAKIVSFELFSDMVDDALDEMREMLQNNKAVQQLVGGGAEE